MYFSFEPAHEIMVLREASAQSRQSLHCSYTWSMKVDKGSDQKSDILPNWMAAHACLKNEFTEDEKYYNLMSWLIYYQGHLKYHNYKKIEQCDFIRSRRNSNSMYVCMYVYVCMYAQYRPLKI